MVDNDSGVKSVSDGKESDFQQCSTPLAHIS